jgi:hypothetical protein
LIKFFNYQSVAHKEFVPEEKTVNAEFYKGVMDHLLKRTERVRPAAFYSRDFILLHNNARTRPQSCKCLPIFDPKNFTSLYHPLYSPDLFLPDYFLFPKLKMKLKVLHFVDVAEIQEAITDELK